MIARAKSSELRACVVIHILLKEESIRELAIVRMRRDAKFRRVRPFRRVSPYYRALVSFSYRRVRKYVRRILNDDKSPKARTKSTGLPGTRSTSLDNVVVRTQHDGSATSCLELRAERELHVFNKGKHGLFAVQFRNSYLFFPRNL